MRIIKSINKLNKEVNFKANIGFVPTMGALHKGHLSLIDSCKKRCNKTLISILEIPHNLIKKMIIKNIQEIYLVKLLIKIKFYVQNLEEVILKEFWV